MVFLVIVYIDSYL